MNYAIKDHPMQEVMVLAMASFSKVSLRFFFLNGNFSFIYSVMGCVKLKVVCIQINMRIKEYHCRMSCICGTSLRVGILAN